MPRAPGDGTGRAAPVRGVAAVSAATAGLVLGVDSGGSGLRLALGAVDPRLPVRTAVCAEPVRTGAAGIDAAHLLEQLLPEVHRLMKAADPGAAVTAAAIGAAGMATLGGRLRAELPAALASALGVRRIALAADAVTAYSRRARPAARRGGGGGTGMIALGTDLSTWRRADGWGHLLGDSGGGAWIGREGLDAAMRAHDGRRGGSPALLARVETVFGPAAGLPGLLYPRTDRPALLASFAPEVAACSRRGRDGGDDPASGGRPHRGGCGRRVPGPRGTPDGGIRNRSDRWVVPHGRGSSRTAARGVGGAGAAGTRGPGGGRPAARFAGDRPGAGRTRAATAAPPGPVVRTGSNVEGRAISGPGQSRSVARYAALQTYTDR